jgi:glycosyltransferase involved in cell wall biosynthesis
LSPAKDFLALCEIARELRRIQPDIVATHTAKAGLLGRLAATALDYPAVFTPHGWSIGGRISKRKGMLFRQIERVASIFASHIVNVCDYEVQLALKSRVSPASKLAMIHNGLGDIDDTFRADTEADPPRLVMVARMAEPKDHATLLLALSRLKHLAWKLELVGGGPLEGLLKQQAENLGIADRVEFLGHVADPAARLGSAQIFVLTSRSEAFPYSILEAMRAGLPVIASRVGGIPEAVEHGHTGLLVSARDVDALERVLAQLISTPALRKRLGDNGRRRFLESFTFDRMFAKTMAIYQQALGTQPCPMPGTSPVGITGSSRTRLG